MNVKEQSQPEHQDKPIFSFFGEVETKSIIIRGDPGSGKTLLASLLTIGYSRVYSNVDFFVKGKKINETVRFMSDIKKLEFSETPGILVLDEMGVNGNSRKSMSKENIEFGELSMLQRKYNVYVIWIAQQDFSFDKNQRLSAQLILHCRAIQRQNKHMLVNVTREKITRNSGNNVFLFDAEWVIDIITINKILKRSYNQLDQSRIIGSKKTEKQKIGQSENKK